MEYPGMLETLSEECRRAAAALAGRPEQDYERATRCPGWDVKALLAHLWRDVDRLADSLAAEPGPEPTADGVTYFRAYDPVGDAPLISERTIEIADRFGTGAELLTSFEEHWPACVAAVRDLPGDRLVRTRIATIRLEEFTRTRVLEAAVHGLDLAEALRVEPWLTPEGAGVTGAILTSLLGVRPPPDLGWHAVDFIEKGTGRRPLSLHDRDELGGLADRFPLLA
jgi:uncharacterized protein (TIGR03083 family)